jgi:hypothetical protein
VVAELEGRLAESSARWKVVYAHHPLYTKGRGHHAESRTLRSDYNFEEVLVSAGVDVYLAGHEHVFQHHVAGGIHHLVGGSSCRSNFYGGEDKTRDIDWIDHSKSPGFITGSVSRDKLVFQFIKAADKSVIRTVVVRKDAQEEEKNDMKGGGGGGGGGGGAGRGEIQGRPAGKVDGEEGVVVSASPPVPLVGLRPCLTFKNAELRRTLTSVGLFLFTARGRDRPGVRRRLLTVRAAAAEGSDRGSGEGSSSPLLLAGLVSGPLEIGDEVFDGLQRLFRGMVGQDLPSMHDYRRFVLGSKAIYVATTRDHIHLPPHLMLSRVENISAAAAGLKDWTFDYAAKECVVAVLRIVGIQL